MHHITTLLFLASSIVSEARAHSGFIYTFDSNPRLKSSRGISLSEDSTKLVLERRIASTESSSLGLLGEEVVEVLDQFGGLQAPLFGSAEGDQSSQKLLIVCHGVDSATVAAVSDTHPSDFYTHTLADFVEDSYLETLAHPTHGSAAHSEACYFDSKDGESTNDFSAKLIALQECLSTQSAFRETFRIIDRNLLVHFPSVSIRSWVGETGTVGVLRVGIESRNVSTDPTLVEGFLRSLFQQLSILLSELKQETTVVLLPAMLTTLPSTQIPTTQYNWKAQLVARSSNPASPEFKSQSLEPVLRDTMLSSQVPSCYKTNSTCAEETNNCSGRGYCHRKNVSTDETLPICYSCKCIEEVKRDKDGAIISRVRWGGPACQKKDISTTFWILASVTIIVFIAISSAISQLLSVGQEELPSVIGAGVGTLRTQR